MSFFTKVEEFFKKRSKTPWAKFETSANRVTLKTGFRLRQAHRPPAGPKRGLKSDRTHAPAGAKVRHSRILPAPACPA